MTAGTAVVVRWEPSGSRRAASRLRGRVGCLVAAISTLSAAAALASPSEAAGAGALGSRLGGVSIVPFAGLLLSIALLPLAASHFWHRHHPQVAAAWALAFAIPFTFAYGRAAITSLLDVAILDYVPFIVLIATLFTIAGGIHVVGGPRGTPRGNAALLATGTVLASVVGTTGAAMLLIRPLLRANRERRHRAHTVVFFIFLVANIGGALTPLGDPPLFLGFLHGVPFFWTLRLWRQVLLVAGLVLLAWAVLEAHWWRREDAETRAMLEQATRIPLRVEGWHNGLLLLGVLGAVVGSGLWRGPTVALLGVEQGVHNLARDFALLALLAVSVLTTSKTVRGANEFSWGPIREVATLFAGIFVTMIPALAILRAGEHGALAPLVRAVDSPAAFFWATGSLSSFLDNAPTYLTFLSTALGRLTPGIAEREAIAQLIAGNPAYLAAVSAGAVFMGANTYIGNAPNFMVKSIAEDSGVPMPSFFAYLFLYSVPILLPAFALATLVFF